VRIKLILTQLLLWALAIGAAVLTGAPDFYALLLLPVIATIAMVALWRGTAPKTDCCNS
jgi:hypothetical protein